MKGFALVLLCALAVQGRQVPVQKSTAAALGENPWVVHLRIATSNNNGLLSTCAGSLINERWVLTAASCVNDATFMWLRYGSVNVVNPSLVTENTLRTVHPEYNADTGENNVALININRVVHSTENIAPVPVSSDTEVPETATFCAFGDNGSDGPGESLSCSSLDLVPNDDGTINADALATNFDVGAPLVSDGVQVGLLTAAGSSFTGTAKYVAWIEEVTGLSLSNVAVNPAVSHAVKIVDVAPVPVDAVKVIN